jgi:hypothetical protein
MIWSNRIRTLLLRGMLLDYGISLERGGVKRGGISRMSLFYNPPSHAPAPEGGNEADDVVKQT